MYFGLTHKLHNLFKDPIPLLKGILILILIPLFYYFTMSSYFSIKPNYVAHFDIILQQDYKGYIDEREYLLKIQEIYRIKEYKVDTNISREVIYQVDKIFQLQNQFPEVTQQEKEFIKKVIISKLEVFYKKGITEEEIYSTLNQIDTFLTDYLKDFENREALIRYKNRLIIELASLLKPNKFVDIAKTLQRQSELIQRIPKTYSLSKGSVVVKKGELITEESYEAIINTGTKEFYESKIKLSTLFIFLICLFSSINFSILGVKFSNAIYILILLILLVLGSIFVEKPFDYLVPFWTPFLIGYFIGGLLLSFFVLIWYLIILNFVDYQLFGDIIGFDYLLFVLFSFVFLFYFLMKNESNRFGIFLGRFDFSILVLIIVYLFLYFAFVRLFGFVENFAVYFSFSIVSVIMSLVLVYFLVLLLGIGIGDIDLGRMRWLLDLNNPVLSDLSRLAPGTFNHSLRVSELSEACAKAINVNPILVKIGALYHDIGKMVRPKYFAENLLEGEKNPHEDKEAFLSASIIKSHISDGLKIAQKYNLPAIIQEFIKTHHGTTTILYFYLKARNLQYSSKKYSFNINEEDFKYPGPKPYTKEMLILMICDSVEAASRSLNDFSYSSLEKLTENIVNRLIQENQFSDVDITFKELKIIKETLVRNLYISYHTRPKYPGYGKKNNP